MLFTLDPLVDQLLASARAGDTETVHPVDGVDGQAEAVGLIADGELQRRVDIALLLGRRGREFSASSVSHQSDRHVLLSPLSPLLLKPVITASHSPVSLSDD